MNSNSSVIGAQYEGRVEVSNGGGTWGTICSSQWTIEDALVVCRMLGFASASRAVINGRYGPGTGPVWLANVNCAGSEATIANCSYVGWGNTGCDHTQDAGVVCSDGESIMGVLVKTFLCFHTPTLALLLQATKDTFTLTSHNHKDQIA